VLRQPVLILFFPLRLLSATARAAVAGTYSVEALDVCNMLLHAQLKLVGQRRLVRAASPGTCHKRHEFLASEVRRRQEDEKIVVSRIDWISIVSSTALRSDVR
jgi:hypothetical protein